MMRISAFLLAGAMIASASTAEAGTSSGAMAVTATVLQSCTIVATPMAFGSITLSGSANDSTSTLTLACTPNASFDILMNDGTHASAGQRRLANLGATEFIPYEIYLDSGRTQRWGNTIGTDTKAGTANALGVAIYTAYGRIGASTTPVTAAAYLDTVTVTVSF